MRKKNRETARAKADTVEADFALGPILQEEIFFERFDDVPPDCASDQVRILVSVYKYRVWVEQFDTCDQVWYVLGDAFHDIRVEIARCVIDREFKTHDPKTIVQIIRERFGGPHAVQRFATFCRSTAWDFSIHESGPQRDNLIRRMYSDPIGDLCFELYAGKTQPSFTIDNAF